MAIYRQEVIVGLALTLIALSESIVDVRSLNFSFGTNELRRKILYGIVQQINAVEIVILEGPSGSQRSAVDTSHTPLCVLVSRLSARWSSRDDPHQFSSKHREIH